MTDPAQLGFIPRIQGDTHQAANRRIGAAEAFRSEAELFDTMDLDRIVTCSDLGRGTTDTLQEAAELLCRAYPSASASELRMRTKQRLGYINRPISGRCTLIQHRELLVTAGWLALLLGCLHYDLGEREQAEAARRRPITPGSKPGTARSSLGPTNSPPGSP